MLDVKHRHKHKKKRERQFSKHLVGFFGPLWPSIMKPNSKEHGKEHQHKILLDEVPNRKRNSHALPYQGRCPTHYNRNGKQRDNAAYCREGDGKRHITARQLGKHV